MASHRLSDFTRLIVSGGDDGSIAVLLAGRTSMATAASIYAGPPVLLSRAHASAVTACAIVQYQQGIFILTSGNDQWIRLWGVEMSDEGDVTVSRLSKVKTNVADVSSMGVLASEDRPDARVVVCGVGMEVVRVELGETPE